MYQNCFIRVFGTHWRYENRMRRADLCYAILYRSSQDLENIALHILNLALMCLSGKTNKRTPSSQSWMSITTESLLGPMDQLEMFRLSYRKVETIITKPTGRSDVFSEVGADVYICGTWIREARPIQEVSNDISWIIYFFSFLLLIWFVLSNLYLQFIILIMRVISIIYARSLSLLYNFKLVLNWSVSVPCPAYSINCMAWRKKHSNNKECITDDVNIRIAIISNIRT